MPGKPKKKSVNEQEGLTMILNRLDQLEQNMKNGFQQVDQRFDQVEQRFEQVDKRFDQVEQHITEVETRLRTEMKKGFRQLNKELFDIGSDLYDRIANTQNKVDQNHQDALNTWVGIRQELAKRQEVDDELYEKVRQLQVRVDALSAE